MTFLTWLRSIAILIYAAVIVGPNFPSTYLVRDINLSAGVHTDQLFAFTGLYDSMQHQVDIHVSAEGLNVFCSSVLHTPVCIEGVCKPLDIILYWDIAGAYLGYATLDGFPLTKFDHELFVQEDYHKLHALLQNKYTSLARRSLDELITHAPVTGEQIFLDGVAVDAVSGATVKEIAQEVVEGGLYSCYTLWHIVHGAVQKRIQEELFRRDSVTYVDQLFRSELLHYNHTALRVAENAAFEKYAAELGRIFRTSKPSVRKYLLNKLSDTFWRDDNFIARFYSDFSDLDHNTKTILIGHLPEAADGCLTYVIEDIFALSSNQLKLLIGHLELMPPDSTKNLDARLQDLVGDERFIHHYLIEDYLQGKTGK